MPGENEKDNLMALTGSAMFAGRMAVREELVEKLEDKERFDNNIINNVMKNMNRTTTDSEGKKDTSHYHPESGKIKFSKAVVMEHVDAIRTTTLSHVEPDRKKIGDSISKESIPLPEKETVDVYDKSKDIEVLINSFLYDKSGKFLLTRRPTPKRWDIIFECIGDTIYEDLKTMRVVKEGDDYFIITDKLYLYNKINTPGEISTVIDSILMYGDLPEINKQLLLNIPSLFILI